MNEHGHLPTADRHDFDDALRHRLACGTTKPTKDDNLFLTLARRPAVLELFLEWVRFVYIDASRLSPTLVELCRVRLVVQNNCVH
jgi:hypothetical protein